MITSALFVCLAVLLLDKAYGFGTDELPAPQATLMKLVIEGVLQSSLPWGLVGIGVLFLSIACSNYTKMHNWTTYRQRSFASRQERMAKLTKFRRFRDELFDGFVPRGETILTSLEAGLSAVMLYDCRVVACARANNGVPDIAQRRADVKVMLAKETPWPKRRALLHKYKIRYFWPSAVRTGWARTRCRQWREIDKIYFMMKVETD